MIISTEAVVLNTLKYGDSSKILNIYSRDYGLTGLIAKGSRHSKHKFGNLLEPMNHIFLTYYFKPGRELQIVQNVELVGKMTDSLDSLEKASSALMILESIYKTQVSGDANPTLFDTTVNALRSIESTDGEAYSLFVKFMFFLARELGFGLIFASEIKESRQIAFSLSNGKIADAVRDKNFIFMTADIYNTLKRISDSNENEAALIKISNDSKRKINDFIIRYLGYHFDRKLHFNTFEMIL